MRLSNICLATVVLSYLSIGLCIADEPSSKTVASSMGGAGRNSAIDKLPQVMSERRQGRAGTRISEDELTAADPALAVAALERYDDDPSAQVRRLAHLYKVRIAKLHHVPAVRQQVTAGLVNALDDADLSPAPYKWLLLFGTADFSAASKVTVRAALAKTEKPHGRLIRVCGIVNIPEELPRLEALLFDEMDYKLKRQKQESKKWYYKSGWSARLARARMGVKDDIVRCIELVDSEEDEAERVLRLLLDVGYIRQPAAIDYLRRYLDRDKRLPSVKVGAPGETYANYVMSILAECLNDYPVKKKEARDYSQKEIESCRKWMSQRAVWNIRR